VTDEIGGRQVERREQLVVNEDQVEQVVDELLTRRRRAPSDRRVHDAPPISARELA
jgi:hypothetical protein